jgi:uncharacterized protein (UPF0276 family)
MPNDRVGLGWRPELAAGIFDALDQIDVLEVIADDYVDAGRERRHSLKVLARQVPLHLHSIALGLADHLHDVTEPVYDLLSELAARTPQPLTVILERDGAYPPMPALLQELASAREALAAGRRRCAA